MDGRKEEVECCMSHVQVTVPNLQSRCFHSATAFSLSPGLTEVTLFGGYSEEWPSNFEYDNDITPIASTIVLRLGEYSYNIAILNDLTTMSYAHANNYDQLQGLIIIIIVKYLCRVPAVSLPWWSPHWRVGPDRCS